MVLRRWAQPACSTIGGLVQTGTSSNIGDDFPINDDGLVAYLSLQGFRWFFNVSNGSATVSLGPFATNFPAVRDLNNAGNVLWIGHRHIIGVTYSEQILLTRGSLTELIAEQGARFAAFFGDAVVNDNDQVVFRARENLPGGSTAIGLFVAEPGVSAMAVPIPVDYDFSAEGRLGLGIGNGGTIVAVARRRTDNRRAILSGTSEGLSELITDNQLPGLSPTRLMMQRQDENASLMASRASASVLPSV